MGTFLKDPQFSLPDPQLPSSSSSAQGQLTVLPEQHFAHRTPFILLTHDLSTKCNSTELILVFYCSTWKSHEDTCGYSLTHLNHLSSSGVCHSAFAPQFCVCPIETAHSHFLHNERKLISYVIVKFWRLQPARGYHQLLSSDSLHCGISPFAYFK